MKYIVETQLPEYGSWHPVIDLDKSKVYPQIIKFDTREEADAWAKNSLMVKDSWRVVEDESE